ncbi:sucrose non-fermenting [Scheffersomyces xylosifermentans]|uniref:sucrose non-fermenting n=1 Tax=Scheffersomyces xylosifermentans TaxID=1304137 RepID=UPI00315DA43C
MNNNWHSDAYSKLGQSLNERHTDQLSTQLSVFQSALVNFAREHGEEIKQNSEFRNKFTQICQSVGIDPLDLLLYSGSVSKTSKSQSSKTQSDNYFISLAVRIVEVCQETRDINGGLIPLKELVSIIRENSYINIEVTESDVEKSLSTLNTLGKGYDILTIHDKKWLKFTSALGGSISNDQKKVYELCGFMGGYVTYRLLRDNYAWDKLRCKTVIDEMIMNGFLWVDSQGEGAEWQYWEPSWISS